MKRLKIYIIALLTVLAPMAICGQASAQSNVDWGTSTDNGNVGYTDLGAWFFNNGYSASQSAGETFAQTGYVGYSASDADPFSFFSNNLPVRFEAVSRNAGNADLATTGFYQGSGASKVLTPLLAGVTNGPVTQTIDGNFGLYLFTPKAFRGTAMTTWFTDRSENEGPQQNAPANAGGDPQALIYSLGQNSWLVAWEDLDVTKASTDRDYNDLLMKVTVTPEPASMALFGLGAGLLAFARRRLF